MNPSRVVYFRARVILSTLAFDEIQELPMEYNYPLHLYEEDVTDHCSNYLEELVAIRHEGFYADPDWMEKMPAKKPRAHAAKFRWRTRQILRRLDVNRES